MKKLLLADDHAIVRSGIRALIRQNFEVSAIEEAENEDEIVKCTRANTYDLILLDISLPGTDFARLMHWIGLASPKSRILIFTMHTEEIYGIRCLQLGAKGFLHKSASNEEIVTAISRVMEGKKYISSRLAELLSDAYGETATVNPFDNLSPRELEIVAHLNNGKSLPEICDILKIQYSTANTHKRRIFEKLNVHNVLSLSRLMQSFDV
ncbi:MAG TPA: response regulator transcription factor [Puia sp.]|nr:response regulator transcription factor [Puia sp.]